MEEENRIEKELIEEVKLLKARTAEFKDLESKYKGVEAELQKSKEELEIQTWGLAKTNETIKFLYRELDQKNKELQKLDKLKTDFINTVSHELRTPLTIMKEFVSLISDEIPGKLTETQNEYIGIIKGNIDRLSRLINDLLDISKIEAGKIELKKTLVDVSDLAKATLITLKPEAFKKDIEFKTSFPAIAMNVRVDSDKIIQIFTNLISNAIKFTPEKGKISVEIKDTENEIECSVIDTGKGISFDDMGKLFGKFQQFGRVSGAGARGTGLGLAISKELVKAHNGKIWAESKINEGSKFIFTLPKYTAQKLFKEYLDNGIEYAVKKGFKLILIIVSLANLDKSPERLTEKVTESILKDIEDVLRKSLRREEGDVAIKGAGEVAVILAECKENVLRVKGRLERILEEYLERKELTEKIKLQFGCVTYPDDGSSAEELIKKARKPQVG